MPGIGQELLEHGRLRSEGKCKAFGLYYRDPDRQCILTGHPETSRL